MMISIEKMYHPLHHDPTFMIVNSCSCLYGNAISTPNLATHNITKWLRIWASNSKKGSHDKITSFLLRLREGLARSFWEVKIHPACVPALYCVLVLISFSCERSERRDYQAITWYNHELYPCDWVISQVFT